MPVREWLRHATSASDDHAPGKSWRELLYGFDARSYPAQEPPIAPGALRKRADRGRGLRGALYTALTWLALLLIIMGGHLAAQTSPPGTEPGTEPAPTPAPGPLDAPPSLQERPLAPSVGRRPTAQTPLQGTEPAPTPAPGPLETLPSPQERLLAPVPSQFNWLQRETPSNPFLEALLGVRGPRRLIVSTSLAEEISDNFDQDPSREIDVRTVGVLGTVYRLDDGQNFISLANTLSAFYQARVGTGRVAYANLALNAGYQLPPLSFGLTESFTRGDSTVLSVTNPLLEPQQRFIRNSITPQVRYDFSPITAATLGYTNTLVVEEESDQGTTITHAVSTGLQHQFSRNLAGGVQYTFTTSDDLGTVASGISTTVSGLTLGPVGGHSHDITAGVGYQLNTKTTATLGVFGRLVNRSGTGAQDSNIYGASIGVRRLLLPTVTLVASVGPTVIQRQGDEARLRANYQLSLDGPIPLFATRTLTLTLTTRQGVQDTVDEVNNVGLVLRQDAEARLTYIPRAFFNAVLFVTYSRNEFLEDEDTGTTVGGEQGEVDNLSSIGVTASYALTRIVSLTGTYRYQRRDSNQAENNFAENRVTIALTGTFPLF